MKIRLPLSLRAALLACMASFSSYTSYSATLAWYGEYAAPAPEETSFSQQWWDVSVGSRADLSEGDSLVFADQNPADGSLRSGAQNVAFDHAAAYGSLELSSALNWTLSTAGSSFSSVSLESGEGTVTFADGLDAQGGLTATGNISANGAVTVKGEAAITGDLTLNSTFTGTNLSVTGQLTNNGVITLTNQLKINSWTLDAGGIIRAASLAGEGESDLVISGTTLELSTDLSSHSLTLRDGASLTAASIATTAGDLAVNAGTSLTSNGALASAADMVIDGTAVSLGTVTAGGQLRVTGSLDAQDQEIHVSGSLSVAGGTATVQGGAVSADSLALETSGARLTVSGLQISGNAGLEQGTRLTGSGDISIGGDLSALGYLSARDLTVAGAFVTGSGTELSLTGSLNTGTWTLGAGSITANSFNGGAELKNMVLQGTFLTLNETAALALDSLTVDGNGSLSVHSLASSGNIAVEFGSSLTSRSGDVSTGGDLTVSGTLDASGHHVSATGNAGIMGVLTADALTAGGELNTGLNTRLTLAGNLSASSWAFHGGSISAHSLVYTGSDPFDLVLNGNTSLSLNDALGVNSLTLNATSHLTAVSVTAEQDILVNGTSVLTSLGSLTAQGDLVVAGTVESGGAVQAGRDLTVSGTLDAARNAVTAAGSLNVSGAVTGGSMDILGDAVLSGSLAVSAGDISIAGILTLEGDAFAISAAGGLSAGSLSGGTIGAGRITANTLDFGTLDTSLTLDGTQLTLNGANTLAWNDLILRNRAVFNGTQTDLAVSSLTLAGKKNNNITELRLKSVNSAGSVSIGANSLFSVTGPLTVGTQDAPANLDVWGWVQAGAASVSGDVSLAGAASTPNRTGILNITGDMDIAGRLTVGGSDAPFSQSQMTTAGSLTVGGAVLLNSTNGNNALTVRGNAVFNDTLILGRNVKFSTARLTAGTTTVGQDAQVTVTAADQGANPALLINGGLTSSGTVNVNKGTLHITGNTHLDAEASAITSKGQATLDGSLVSQGTVKATNGGITIGQGASLSGAGSVTSLGDLVITSGGLVHSGTGFVKSTAGSVTITGNVQLDLADALLSARNNISVTGDLSSSGSVEAGTGSITISGDATLSGADSSLLAQTDLSIGGTLNNSGTVTSAQGDILISGDALLNQDSSLLAEEGSIKINGTLTTSGTDGHRVTITAKELLSGAGGLISDTINLTYTDLTLTDREGTALNASSITLDGSLLSSASGISATDVVLKNGSTLVSALENLINGGEYKVFDEDSGQYVTAADQATAAAAQDMVLETIATEGSGNMLESHGNLFLKGNASGTGHVLNGLTVTAWGGIKVTGDLTLGTASPDVADPLENTAVMQGAGIDIAGDLSVLKGSSLKSQEANLSDWEHPLGNSPSDTSSLTISGNLDYQGSIFAKGAMTVHDVTGSNGGSLIAGHNRLSKNVTANTIDLTTGATFQSASSLTVTSGKEITLPYPGSPQFNAAIHLTDAGTRVSAARDITMREGGLLLGAGSAVSAGGNMEVGATDRKHDVLLLGAESGDAPATTVSAGGTMRVHGDMMLLGNAIKVSAKNIFV